ncbi:MAG: ATP/GTP-binding protein [Bacteroidota bacterium]
MKKLLFLLIVVGSNVYAQHSLEKVWTTDSTSLKNPESVRYDPKAKILFVSNIGEFGKDNVGYVSKIGLDGKIIKKDWVTGLTGTKGLAMNKNTLYAAENAAVAVIDIAKGTITKRITIEGAQMLNDITVDSKGAVYVSDSKTGKIHKIENDKPSVYLENLTSVNGLLAVDNDLYILADGKFWRADSNKKLTQLVDGLEGGMDSIEMVEKGGFLLTNWNGIIYYVKDDGSKQVLSDTRDKKINAADLGWDPATKILYVPQMLNNRVTAFKLK